MEYQNASAIIEQMENDLQRTGAQRPCWNVDLRQPFVDTLPPPEKDEVDHVGPCYGPKVPYASSRILLD